MRIWSLHPRYLDPQGLVALWRETLLAQAVLRGQTKGYRQHPQLERFKAQADPVAAVAAYLVGVHAEAIRRGYSFDGGKIAPHEWDAALMPVRQGQIEHEWRHLLGKLAQRSPALHDLHSVVTTPDLHPLFSAQPGGIEDWER